MELFSNDLNRGREFVYSIEDQIAEIVRGQAKPIRHVLIALFSGGHILLEGVPGVAKTLLANCLARTVAGGFARIQGSPDLMPSDIIGRNRPRLELVGAPSSAEPPKDVFIRGPLLKKDLIILHIDEINRTMPKTQSAVLEAMQERKVTVEGQEFKLHEAFMVIATRNPIERGETNELPEAQRDRFMMETEMGYPTAEDEKMIALDPSYLEMTKKVVDGIKPVLEPDRILQIRHLVENEIKVSEGAIDYIYRLVDATRNPEKLGVSVVPTDKGTQKIEDVISAGASPRGTIHLVQAAKFVAWLDRRMAVTPEHVQTIVPEVLLHKVFFKPGVARRSNLAKSFLNEIVKKVTPW